MQIADYISAIGLIVTLIVLILTLRHNARIQLNQWRYEKRVPYLRNLRDFYGEVVTNIDASNKLQLTAEVKEKYVSLCLDAELFGSNEEVRLLSELRLSLERGDGQKFPETLYEIRREAIDSVRHEIGLAVQQRTDALAVRFA